MTSYALVIPPAGEMCTIEWDATDPHQFVPLYREIGCTQVEPLEIHDYDITLWTDEEALIVEPVPAWNPRTTGLVLLACGRPLRQSYLGTAVVTGTANEDGQTLGLSAETVADLVRIAERGGNHVVDVFSRAT